MLTWFISVVKQAHMMSHVTSDSAPEAGPEQHELQVIGESEMPADEAAEPPAKPPQQEEIVENAMSWCDTIRYRDSADADTLIGSC